MNDLQLDYLVKALLDGVTATEELAARSGIEQTRLVQLENELERGASLIRGFNQFASENMKPAGLPPPKNLYFNPEMDIDEQIPEYYAFEAVQRGITSLDECLRVCKKLGIEADLARPAIENVCIPWREINGWRSYAKQNAAGHLVLMDKTPVKIKKPLEHLRKRLSGN